MRFAVLIAAALVLAGPAARADIVQPTAEDLLAQGPKEAVLGYLENFNAASVDGLISMFSERPGVKIIENGSVSLAGRPAMQEGFAKLFAAQTGLRQEVMGEIEVVMLGPAAAVAVYSWTLFLPDEKGVEAPLFNGLTTLTLAMEAEEWRIIVAHSSSSANLD
jgi:ketosteroid isomerase-like protein